MSDRFYATFAAIGSTVSFTGYVRNREGDRCYRVDTKDNALELAYRLNDAYELGKKEATK